MSPTERLRVEHHLPRIRARQTAEELAVGAVQDLSSIMSTNTREGVVSYLTKLIQGVMDGVGAEYTIRDGTQASPPPDMPQEWDGEEDELGQQFFQIWKTYNGGGMPRNYRSEAEQIYSAVLHQINFGTSKGHVLNYITQKLRLASTEPHKIKGDEPCPDPLRKES